MSCYRSQHVAVFGQTIGSDEFSGSIPDEDAYPHLGQDAPASVIVRFPAGTSFVSLRGMPVAGDFSQ